MHAVAPEWASAIVLVSSAYIHVLFTVSMTHEGGILGAADISLGSEVVNHEERLDYVERLGVDAGPASTFIISVRMIPLAGSYSSMHMQNQTQVSNITSVPQSVAVWIRTTCARDVLCCFSLSLDHFVLVRLEVMIWRTTFKLECGLELHPSRS